MVTKPATLEALLLGCAGATVPLPITQDPTPQSALELVQGRTYFFSGTVRVKCIHYDAFQVAMAGGPKMCSCQGRNWVPSKDRDAWEEALRVVQGTTRGGSPHWAPGDWVEVILDAGPQGKVVAGEGLRGFLALMSAVYRMLRQVPGMETGCLKTHEEGVGSEKG